METEKNVTHLITIEVHSLHPSSKGTNSYTSPHKSQKISLALKIWRMPILTVRLHSGAYSDKEKV